MPEVSGRSRSDEFDGERLSLARQFRGFTKTDLAQKVELSAAAIAQFENGVTRPRAEVVVGLAFALRVPVSFFRLRPGTMHFREYEFHFRRLRSSRRIDRARVLARTTLLAELVQELQAYVVFPRVAIPHDLSLAPDEPEWRIGIERAAQIVRDRWQLGEGPISSMARLLEVKGCIVTRLRSDSGEIDAFSGWWGERPYVILSSDKVDAARSRFDSAHELGHLVLHPEPDPTNKLFELQAHLFAGSFLMPTATIGRELPATLDWPRLIELKARWKVSIQALLRRGLTVGRFTPAQYRRAMTQLSAKGWRTREPGLAGPIEVPVLVEAAIERVGRERGVDLNALSAILHLGREDIETLVSDALEKAS
jgi:Zn-dependent peptidase ImmA (M78 family)/DNA-binding XRE family transcriptional regulator